MDNNEQKDLIGSSLKNFSNNSKQKLKNKADNYFNGWGEGSVFSIVGGTIRIIKEMFSALNEAIKVRRAERDERKGRMD